MGILYGIVITRHMHVFGYCWDCDLGLGCAFATLSPIVRRVKMRSDNRFVILSHISELCNEGIRMISLQNAINLYTISSQKDPSKQTEVRIYDEIRVKAAETYNFGNTTGKYW